MVNPVASEAIHISSEAILFQELVAYAVMVLLEDRACALHVVILLLVEPLLVSALNDIAFLLVCKMEVSYFVEQFAHFVVG